MEKEENDLTYQSCLLTVGQLYSYNEICDLMCEPYYRTGGDAKDRELKHWSRFFKWEKVGKKYKITEILDEPEKKQLKISNVKYFSLIWAMMIELNRRFNKNYVVDFRGKLMQMFGFFSEAFCNEKCERGLGSEAVRFITSSLNGSFESAMNRLHNKGIIKYEKYFEVRDLQTQIVDEITEEQFERYNQLKLQAIEDYFKSRGDDIPVCKRGNPLGVIILKGGFAEYSKTISDAMEKEFNVRVFEKRSYQILDTKLTYNKEEIDQILERYKNEEGFVDTLEVIGKEINRRANDAIRKKLTKPKYEWMEYEDEETYKEIQELLKLNSLNDNDIEEDTLTDDNLYSTPINDIANKRFYHNELLHNKQDPEDKEDSYIKSESIEDTPTNERSTIAEDITADEPAYTQTDDPWFNECQEYVDMFEPQETIEPVQTEDIHETEKINDCFNDLFDDALDKAEEALEEFTIQDYIDNNIAIPQHLQKEYERYLDEQKRKWKRQYKNTLQTSLMIEPETNTDTDNITELNGNNSSLNEFEYKGEKLSLTDEELVKWFEGNDDYFEHLRHKDICKLYKEARFRLNYADNI